MVATESPQATAAPIPAPPPRRFRRIIKWGERVLASFGLAVLLLLFSPIIDVIYPHLDRQSELSFAKYILVLGGEPYRVLEGVQLLKDGFGQYLVVSNHDVAADLMREQAIQWGAPPERILMDRQSWTTADHPRAIAQSIKLDPSRDVCIVVTNYTHMARSRACFVKAGYRHLVFREPRWERSMRPLQSYKSRMRVLPYLIYEGAAWVEYWIKGYV